MLLHCACLLLFPHKMKFYYDQDSANKANMTQILKTLRALLNRSSNPLVCPVAFDPKKIKTCASICNYFPLPSITLGSLYHDYNISLHKWPRAFILRSRELIGITPAERIVWTCNYFLWMFYECIETKNEHFQQNWKKFLGPLQHPKSWKQGVLIVGFDTKTVEAQFAKAKFSSSHIHDFNV